METVEDRLNRVEKALGAVRSEIVWLKHILKQEADLPWRVPGILDTIVQILGEFPPSLEEIATKRTYADLIREYLCREVEYERLLGRTAITFRAGDVHKAVGLDNQMPNVCQVLEGAEFHARCRVRIARVLHSPPSGRGSSLTVEFRILP